MPKFKINGKFMVEVEVTIEAKDMYEAADRAEGLQTDLFSGFKEESLGSLAGINYEKKMTAALSPAPIEWELATTRLAEKRKVGS